MWGVHSFLPDSKQGEKSAGVHSFLISSISKSWESNSVGAHSFFSVSKLGGKSVGVHSFFPVLIRFGKTLVWGYALS